MLVKTNTNIKFYWTKPRKQQLLYWKILTANFFLAVTILGAYQTLTEKYISKLSLIPTVNAKQEQIEPETLEIMVERIAKEEDFKWVSYFKRLISCESSWNPYALNNNGKALGIDVGLLQLNTKYNPKITVEQMMNPEFSIRYAMQEIKAGRQSRWVCDKKIKNK